MSSYNITNVRAVLTIMVLFGHCLYAFAGLEWAFNVDYSELASFFTKYIYSFHMSLFFAISGLLFQRIYVSKMLFVNIYSFIHRRFMRLIVPLIAVKFLICNPVNIFIGRYNPWNSRSFFIEMGHLWFLLALFIICSSLYVVKYYLSYNKFRGGKNDIALVSISFLIMSISALVPNFGIGVINSVFYYQFFFVIGMLIETQKLWGYISTKIIYITAFAAHAYISLHMFYINTHCGILMRSGISILGCIAWLGIVSSIQKNKILSFVDKYGMGIYLFHFPIIYLTLNALEGKGYSAFSLIVILTFISLIFSIVCTAFFRKIHIEFLIGEIK